MQPKIDFDAQIIKNWLSRKICWLFGSGVKKQLAALEAFDEEWEEVWEEEEEEEEKEKENKDDKTVP